MIYLGDCHLLFLEINVFNHPARYLISALIPKNKDLSNFSPFFTTGLEYPVFTGLIYTISADIVYINPVNTGYSRPVVKKGEKLDKSLFFGINADIKYLAGWLNTFISRNNRWQSPKYIIGESYGGTRVMGLAAELQNRQWMYLNGVIMVSPADYKVLRTGSVLSSSLNLPYFTAAAWYHKMLPEELQNKDLLEILPLSEQYAINELIPAMAKGGFISDTERNKIAERMSYFSGIKKNVILQHNLDVPKDYFWKELLRDENGFTIGRLDSRYKGLYI